jgi:microcystin-dependent protein
MSSPFLGEIRIFPYTFAPRGWAFCAGQILSIAQNTALFSLLGTNYGGNGQTTFGLPDLRGRAPIGQGQGPGLTNISLGEMAGVESTTLLSTNMPQHTHSLAEGTTSTTKNPTGKYIGLSSGGAAYTDTKTGAMAADAIGLSGGSQPFSIRNPYLGLSPCIALEGIFPSRN